MIYDFNEFSIKNRKKSKWKNNGFRTLFENLYMLNNKLNINSKSYKKYNLNNYEIYVMNEKFGEPRFHVIINRKIKRFSDFPHFLRFIRINHKNLTTKICCHFKSKFCIKIRILDSSTEYNSLDNFNNLELELKEWLSFNLSFLKSDWNLLNKNRKI
jgi:hypothetical protein